MGKEVEYGWYAKAEFGGDMDEADCANLVYFGLDFENAQCNDCGQPAPSGTAYWDIYILCDECEYIYYLLRQLEW